MKYIIEFEDEPFVRLSALFREEGLYRAKGFNSLVFDQFGLDKLTPLDKELEEAYQNGVHEGSLDVKERVEGAYQKGYEVGQHEATTLEYQQGLDDAWECARKLFSEMSDTEINLVFPHEWNNGGFKALMALHPQDAIDRIKAYEDRQKLDEIKVGDEVLALSGKAIVFRRFIDDNGVDVCSYWYPDENRIYRDITSTLEKTGRHFPQVAELFKAMKEGAQ